MKTLFTTLFILAIGFIANAQSDTVYNNTITPYRQMVKDLKTVTVKESRDVYYAPERATDNWTQVAPKDNNEGWIQVVPKGWNKKDNQQQQSTQKKEYYIELEKRYYSNDFGNSLPYIKKP